MTTDTAHDIAHITRFYGLSTATKPVSAMIGATFLETDTRLQFIYVADNTWVRDETMTVVQAGPVEVQSVFATDELLADILKELRINNAHLEIVTDTPSEDLEVH